MSVLIATKETPFATGQELIDEKIIDPEDVELFDRNDIIGLSVRARKAFKKGDVVCSYGGKSYGADSVFAKNSTSLFRLNLYNELEIDGHPMHKETENHLGSYINDANGLIPLAKNNVRLFYKLHAFNGVPKCVLLVKADCDIAKDEELLLSYGEQYWNAFDKDFGSVIGRPSLKMPTITARKTMKRVLSQHDEDE